MKKLLILIAFAPLISSAQISLGYTKKDIQESLQSWTEGQDEDGVNYIKGEFNGEYYYYFNEFGVCYICEQVVHDPDQATKISLDYDQKFKILDDNTWEYKYDGSTIGIVMNFMHDTKSYVFIYYEK